MKWFSWALLGIAILFVGIVLANSIARTNAYTTFAKDEKPMLELPFDTSVKSPTSIMPMGETINHDAKSGGHPGIDFMWRDGDNVKIYASMEAEVTAIIKDKKTGTYDLVTRNGDWGVSYTEMESVNSQLNVGSIVKAGDWVGIPNHPKDAEGDPKYRMIHWEFGYADYTFFGKISVRICPMNYFSPSAKATIGKIWVNTDWPEMKANAPDICSNYYFGKNE